MKINQVLKALSHPIRREIITRLRDGPQSAGELASNFGVSKPTMSTHFAALKDADLITAERDGVTINYHLNTTVAEEAMSAVMGILGAGEEKAPAIKNKRKKAAI
jgi:DNA-binding transcriptional ArsR family regulator